MTVLFRPLTIWPHKPTADRRHAHFDVGIERTLRELEYEVNWLQRRDQELIITIGAGYREGDLRVDGRPRADARAPIHPGVEVSFESRFGRLTYATDVFYDWRDNVRAIAKGLEALRAINRWGVAKQGQQYTGFALLAAGPSIEEQGRLLVERFGSVKEALRHTHPDTGDTDMTSRDYQAVIAYRDRDKEQS